MFSSLIVGAFACSGVDSDLFSGSLSDGGTVTDAGSDAKSTRDSGKSDSGSGGGGGGGSVASGGGGGGGGGAVVPALCGSSLTCTSSEPTCCGAQSNDGVSTATTTYTCTPDPSSCNAATDVAVGCRDNGDCGGSTPICCGELQDIAGDNGYRSVSCRSSCDVKFSDGGLSPLVPFCSGSADSACASTGFQCQASLWLAGFNVCGTD